jgi:t-SNARE complex subunit (syntaxin)
LDSDSDLLDVLEQQVNEILAAMPEVHQLFGKTLQELQKQRHILVQIEGETSKAVEEMEVGNEDLRKAQGRQRSSTKCICCIVVIAIIVITAVVLIILWKFKWSAPSATAAAVLLLGVHS